MIEQHVLNQIENALNGSVLDEGVVSGLREKWPKLHFTYCTEDDIHTGSPIVETDTYSLYLVDSSDHCLALTSDPANATGLVIAEHIDEDE